MNKQPSMETYNLMKARHAKELATLRDTCNHPKEQLLLREDHSCVGAGSAYPSVHIICPLCGCLKIMFPRTNHERNTYILPTLNKQIGIRDQRLGLFVENDSDMDRKTALDWIKYNLAIDQRTAAPYGI